MLTNLPLRLHQFIKYGLLPTCMFSVVFVHYWYVKQGLSPWKGGAFGMYSTYRPLDSHVYINNGYINPNIISQEQSLHLRNYLFYKNNKNLQRLIESLSLKQDTLQIQIFEPRFNAKTATLERIITLDQMYVNSERK